MTLNSSRVTSSSPPRNGPPIHLRPSCISSQPLLLLLLPLLVPNIFSLSSAGLAFCSSPWAAKREQNDRHGDERRNAAERRVAGCGESARGVPNGVGFCLARTVLRPEYPPAPRSRAASTRSAADVEKRGEANRNEQLDG